MPEDKLKALAQEKVHLDVKQDGDTIHLKTYTADRVMFDYTFTVGKEFEYTRETTNEKIKVKR